MRGVQQDWGVTTSANLADAVGYARSEFRDGRSEGEVFELLLRSGQPDSIRGLIHELYLESLGVCLRDQIKKSLTLGFGVLSIVILGLIFTRELWLVPALAVALGVYAFAVDRMFLRCWKRRANRFNPSAR